jgi:hypothetical protein
MFTHHLSNASPLTSQLTRRALGALALTTLAALMAGPAFAQARVGMDAAVAAQIGNLLQEKEARSAAQAKIGSQLWYALQASRGQALPGLDTMYANATQSIGADGDGIVSLDITATVSDRLLAQIGRLGGTVIYASAPQRAIRATLPLAAVETLAGMAAVITVEPAHGATTNVGALTSQGYVTHRAREAVLAGYTGAGVRVGVLSDSALPARVTALIASGDLPADTVVLPGQAGPTTGTDEGTAMMEIVYDMAPGAKLFFATAFTSAASFADNIRALRAAPYNCDIIVDDINYFNEGAFQDGPIAQAVNDVTASGALYFSSAGNSGNVTSSTSGTWEGDFVAGAAGTTPLPAGYVLHRFITGLDYNVLTLSSGRMSLKWADPLGASSNDYDLFVLDSTGTTIACSSTNIQSGTQDPYEFCGSGLAAGQRIVIAKKAAATPLALRLDSLRGNLQVFTTGATYGHNAGSNTVSTAAVYWNASRGGTKPFTGGAANPTENFSSDGPRKIFFNPNGTPVTPGNLLFATNGGITLAKPDIAAADGVSTKTPGFLPFFGTSAAAPSAAGIAALVKSARPDYTNVKILNVMKQSALDIRLVGVDRDSGSGIVMGKNAVDLALITP